MPASWPGGRLTPDDRLKASEAKRLRELESVVNRLC